MICAERLVAVRQTSRFSEPGIKKRAEVARGAFLQVCKILVLQTDADLEAAVVFEPGIRHQDTRCARRFRRVAGYLLHQARIRTQDVGTFEADFDIAVDLVADRAIEQALLLLPDRQADAAVQRREQVLRTPVVGQASRPRTLSYIAIRLYESLDMPSRACGLIESIFSPRPEAELTGVSEPLPDTSVRFELLTPD